MSQLQDAQPVGKFAQFPDGIWREVTKGSAGVHLYTHPVADDTALLRQCLRALQDIYIAPEHLDYIADWWPACMEAIIALRDRLGEEK